MHNEAHGPAGARTSPRKAVASGWIGSALEYYDFFIYAQAAALIFPQVFFPKGNPTVALIASLATYAVGYVARPVGAFVLGHWGDRHGRKNVLVLAMLLMGASTFAVALLPTYAQVGLLAPLLLVLLRLVQGFAVAGELGGASAMIVEHAPFGRRGYYASFALQGTQAGQIIAAAVFLPLSAALPAEAFASWGWRIPFLLSAVVVVGGLPHPPSGRRDARVPRRGGRQVRAEGAGPAGGPGELAEHAARRGHGAGERHRRHDVGVRGGVRHAARLRHRR